jgi:trimeric autotransporter adhesin
VFETLTTVKNNATDNEATHYNTYDEKPDLGDNTYRVKVTFQDGSTKITEAKTIKFKGLSDIQIYPNPANDLLSIDLSAYKNQAVEVALYNYIGQPVQVTKVDKVENTIVELPVGDQPVGQYMLRVKSKGRKDVVKSVVIAH